MAERLMKTVFDWEHFAIYLSGAMDFASDGGKGWRDDWTDKLISIGINQKQIYNPCKKPFNGAQFDLDDEARIWKECRDSEDWDRLEKTASQIMHVDLRLVDKSDIILVNFPKINDPSIDFVIEGAKFSKSVHDLAVTDLCDRYSSMRVPTYGTLHEIVVAHQQRKPIFIVWEGTGKADCSAWIMKLVGHRNVFSNVRDMIDHLAAISHGKKAFDANEWLLLDPK